MFAHINMEISYLSLAIRIIFSRLPSSVVSAFDVLVDNSVINENETFIL